MAYTKQTWIDSQSPLNAERMNHIEDGIYQNAEDAAKITEDVNKLSEEIANSTSEVYVGETEPTAEAVKLWIDLSDEGEDDDTGVTSVNGMTGDVQLDIPSVEGLASEEYVNNALSNIQVSEGVYQLIETITLTEDVTPIDRTNTPDGTAYAFDDVVVVIDLPAGSYTSAVYYAQIYFGSTFISLYQETAPHATSKKRAAFQFESRNGKINARSIGFSVIGGSGDNAYTEGGAVKECGDFRFAEPIIKIRVRSNTTLPAGTEIKIYGAVE